MNGQYIFGGIVKNSTNLVKNFATSDGYLIGINGFFDQLVLNERAFFIGARVSKILPVLNPNPNSGIKVGAGA